MSNIRTILYSVSTGYFARNLLRTGVIERLLKNPDIRIVIVSPGYEEEEFVKEFSFDKRIYIENMHPVNNSYDFMDAAIWKFWLLGHKHRGLHEIYKLAVNFQLYKRYYRKYHKLYKKIFDVYKPNLVVGGTPGVNSRYDIPIFAEAQKRGIPTIGLVHSWDHIAKRKGPLWVRPDFLGVWNEFQKKDAMDVNFYNSEKVILLGPPHFDYYWRNDTFMTRDDFFKKLGLNPRKKLITMIATVPAFSRSDFIVDILLDALKKDKFSLPVQLVCRPTPSIERRKNEEEFGKYLNNPDVIVDNNQSRWTPKLGWNPDKAQITHFANLIKHTDVQVSIASTATIEAALLDRPVVNVGFNTVEPERFQQFVLNSVYKNHFKAIVDIGATYIAKDPESLITGINMYLIDPGIHRGERERLKNTLIYKADGKAVERISEAIISIVK